MKRLTYLLPVFALFFSSCLKSNTDNNVLPIVNPTGTFSGQFRKIHLNKANGKIDTVKSAFTVQMNTDNTFKVTSDTTTVHAGSFGNFQVTSGYIYFADSTFPKTGFPAKTHLAGNYVYAYDGSSVFQFYTLSADTLVFQYDLKKTN